MQARSATDVQKGFARQAIGKQFSYTFDSEVDALLVDGP